MTIQDIDPKLIDPNPYQPATRLAHPDLSDLASIREVGLLQIPAVRPHPTVAGRYQRVNGHRRQAAWIKLRPGELMPNDVWINVSDRQMFEFLTIENAERKDLNAIEKALSIQRYTADFKASQTEAGKLFHLQQASVSNLLRLLELPGPIQDLVAAGQLPERLARRLLMFASLQAEKDIIALAHEVAEHSESDEAFQIWRKHTAPKTEMTREQLFDARLVSLVATHCHAMHTLPWKKDWKPGISADINGALIPLPACKDCPFAKHIDYAEFCLRPACWSAKLNEHARQQAAAVAKNRHAAVAAPDEEVKVITDPNQVQALLASKHPAVRLLPRTDGPTDYYSVQTATKLTGSPFVQVGLIQQEAEAVLKTLTPRQPDKKKTSSGPSLAEIKKRQTEQEAQKKMFKEAERKMMAALTPTFARLLPNDTVALFILADLASENYYPFDNKAEEKLARQLHFDEGKTFKAKPADLKIFIAHSLIDGIVSEATEDTLPELRRVFVDYAARFGLKLPAGWDAPLGAEPEKARPAKKSSRRKK